MRFKRPKNGHYTKYCFGCRHYEFERQVGCAYLGKCTAIEDEPTEQDAYDPPCGLWEKRADTPQTDCGKPIECEGCGEHICIGCEHQAKKEAWRKAQTDCSWK